MQALIGLWCRRSAQSRYRSSAQSSCLDLRPTGSASRESQLAWDVDLHEFRGDDGLGTSLKEAVSLP